MTYLKLLLALLFSFFSLGVEGEDDDPPAGDEGEEDPPAAASGEDVDVENDDDDDEGIEGMFGDATIEAPPPKKDPQRESAKAQNRKQEIADAAAAAAAAAVRAAMPQPQPQQFRDQTFDQEEETLRQVRAKGDADEIARYEWWIDDKRQKRQSQNVAQMAFIQARETDDKADFREVRDTHPKRYNAYKDRVEKIHNELLQKGTYVGRRILMRQLMGQDIDEGKVKLRTRKAEKLPENVTRIERGRSPTMRSDVSGNKGARTDHQKREQRLLNKAI